LEKKEELNVTQISVRVSVFDLFSNPFISYAFMVLDWCPRKWLITFI